MGKPAVYYFPIRCARAACLPLLRVEYHGHVQPGSRLPTSDACLTAHACPPPAIRGRAEPIKLALAAKGIEFDVQPVGASVGEWLAEWRLPAGCSRRRHAASAATMRLGTPDHGRCASQPILRRARFLQSTTS